MKTEPTYLSGAPIHIGDSICICDWAGTVEEINDEDFILVERSGK